MQNKKLITSKTAISLIIISIILVIAATIFIIWNTNKFRDNTIFNVKNSLAVKAEIITTGIEKLMLDTDFYLILF